MAASDDSTVFSLLGDAAPGPTDPQPSAAPGGAQSSDDSAVFNLLGDQTPGPTAPHPGPAAPAGPSRLRGQALIPPPAPRPAGGHPGAPVAPSEDLSLPAVVHGAAENALPSIWNNLKQTVSPLMPQNWAQTGHGVMSLARGVGSKTGLLIPANAAQKAADEAPLDAVLNMYGTRYDLTHPGAPGGILQTLKHDPAAPISDAAAVASLLAGGEGIAAKVPGAVGDALSAASRVGKVAQYADPTAALAGTAGFLSRKAAPLTLGAMRHGVGGGLGAAAGAMVPIPHLGPYIGYGMGNYLANKMLPHAMPPIVGKIGGALSRIPGRVAPALTTFGGMQPDSSGGPPGEASPAGAPGSAAPAPAGSPDPGAGLDPRERFRAMYPHFASGMTDDQVNAIMQEPEFKGLYDAAPAGGSPGPAPGGPGSAAGGGDPGNVADVIRQAEGGGNQPVGYRPGGGSSARGAYQMIDGTYRANLRKYHPEIASGMSDNQIDAYRNSGPGWALNDTMGRQMVQDEMGQLQHEGLAPTADNVGALHMLGNTRLLHADPNTPIEQVTGAGQRAANAGVFRNVRTAGDYLAWMRRRNQMAEAQLRPAHAAGGQVIDMTERLLQRAEGAQKAAQASTKPLLGLSDATVAQALRVAQRGL